MPGVVRSSKITKPVFESRVSNGSENQMLGNTDAANTLQQILDEEYEADEKLTTLAEGYINHQAMD